MFFSQMKFNHKNIYIQFKPSLSFPIILYVTLTFSSDVRLSTTVEVKVHLDLQWGGKNPINCYTDAHINIM